MADSQSGISTTEEDDFDYSTLVTDDAAAQVPAETTPEPATEPATEPVAEATPETTPPATPEAVATEPAAKPQAEAATPPTPSEFRPGTPDKVVQSVQQDVKALDRKLDAVLKVIESQGGKATEAQAQAVKTIADKRVSLRDRLAELVKDGREDTANPFKEQAEIAKAAVELEDAVNDKFTTLEKRQAELERQNAELRAERAAEREAEQARKEADAYWANFSKENPTIDGQKLWNQAIDEGKADGIEGDALLSFASGMFKAAVKAAKAVTPAPIVKPASTPVKPAPVKAAAATARPAPPKTPGGTTVNVRSGGAAPVAKLHETDGVEDFDYTSFFGK